MKLSPRFAGSTWILVSSCLTACVGPPQDRARTASQASSSGSSSAGAPKSEAYAWRNVTMLGGVFVT